MTAQGFYNGVDGCLSGHFLKDGKNYEVDKRFSYVDKSGKMHTLHRGFTFNGGNVPKLLYPVIGGPFLFCIEAYAFHDFYCQHAADLPPDDMKALRDAGDSLFREILDYLYDRGGIDGAGRENLELWKRSVMEWGVRQGSRAAVRAAKRAQKG